MSSIAALLRHPYSLASFNVSRLAEDAGLFNNTSNTSTKFSPTRSQPPTSWATGIVLIVLTSVLIIFFIAVLVHYRLIRKIPDSPESESPDLPELTKKQKNRSTAATGSSMSTAAAGHSSSSSSSNVKINMNDRKKIYSMPSNNFNPKLSCIQEDAEKSEHPSEINLCAVGSGRPENKILSKEKNNNNSSSGSSSRSSLVEEAIPNAPTATTTIIRVENVNETLNESRTDPSTDEDEDEDEEKDDDENLQQSIMESINQIDLAIDECMKTNENKNKMMNSNNNCYYQQSDKASL